MPEKRNCFRCGFEFTSVDGQRICSTCRMARPVALPVSRGKPLSFRENQVTKLVSEGFANKAIATELHLTEGTVKEYMNRIFHKLGANNRTHAAVLWLQLLRAVPETSPVIEAPDSNTKTHV